MTAMLYVILGIKYFVQRPQCWVFFLKHLFLLLFVSMSISGIAIIFYLFTFSFTSVFSFLSIPTAIQTCNFIIGIIAKRLILPNVLTDLFDYVICKKISVQKKDCQNEKTSTCDTESIVGRIYRNKRKGPLFFMNTTQMLFSMFVNMIPLIGPVLVIFIEARNAGFSQHKRFFTIKGYTEEQINFIWAHYKKAYFLFGITTLFLESIPILGYFFLFTNSIAAALWVADLESLTSKAFCFNK